MLGFTIHHVGVAVRDIPKTAEFYVRSFGYRIESAIIHDPAQSALVQFLRFPGDRTYLELVQPEGPGSKLSQAIKSGGGLHHICYAADDIERACKELCAGGLFLIAPPVPAVAFKGRRIAWLADSGRVITELVERGPEDEFTLNSHEAGSSVKAGKPGRSK